jgi:predicted DNA-binding transcriptional regulator YafY
VPASFARPASFDALQYVRVAIATLPRAHSVSVLLHTDLASVQQRLFSEIGTLELHRAGRRPVVLLRSEADDLDWFMRELSRLPFAFEILGPSALVGRVQAHAKRLLKHARAGSTRSSTPARSRCRSARPSGRHASAC